MTPAISAATINDLLCQLRNVDDHIGFFFCEYNNASSLTALTILACLIRQFLSADALSKTIEGRQKDLFKDTSPDAEDLGLLLTDVAATSRRIIFVIDGFDECTRADRLIVLKMLHGLVSSSRSIVKVFLSSRDDMIGDIARVFDTCQQMTMDCEEAQADIPTYINDVIVEKIGNGELEVGSIQLVQDIRDALIKGANGM